MAKISIIMPVYNSEKFIATTLNSLINQTFSDIEIICINDGSKDNSYNILKEYSNKDKRIKLFTQENSGPAKARNVGLANATGKYIMFCDSDDEYKPNMCERMYEEIEKNDVDLVLCYANVDVIDQRTDIIGDEFLQKLDPGTFEVPKNLIPRMNGFLWNKIFKKELIDKYKIDFPTGHVHDDPAFVLQYNCITHYMTVIPDKLYIYKIREGSVMDVFYKNKSMKDFIDTMYLIKYCYEFLKRNNLVEEYNEVLALEFIIYLLFAYSFIDKAKLDILLEEATSVVNTVGLENFGVIRNKALLNSIAENDKLTAKKELYKALEISRNKFASLAKFYKDKTDEVNSILEEAEKYIKV